MLVALNYALMVNRLRAVMDRIGLSSSGYIILQNEDPLMPFALHLERLGTLIGEPTTDKAGKFFRFAPGRNTDWPSRFHNPTT